MRARVYHFEKLLQTIDLTSDDILIGRSNECQISINEPLISRKHCRICFKNKQYVIHDLGEGIGVTVMGSKIEKNGSLTVPLSLHLEILEEYRIEFEDELDSKTQVKPILKKIKSSTTQASVVIQPLKKNNRRKLQVAALFLVVSFFALNHVKDSEDLRVGRLPAAAKIQSVQPESLNILKSADVLKQVSNINCIDEKICKKFFLQKDSGEGLFINENYVIVALKLEPNRDLVEEEKEKLDLIHLSLIGLNPSLKKEFKNQRQVYVVGLRDGHPPLISYMPHTQSQDRKEFDSNMQNYLLRKNIDVTYQWTRRNGVEKI
jgi:pSer/pThr/pTyr-binding forkhead associated (FHA) protein